MKCDWRTGNLVVRDLQSTNGTFVDGKTVNEAILRPGQILRLGDVELKLDLTTPEPRPGTAFLNKSLATNANAIPPKPIPFKAVEPTSATSPKPAGMGKSLVTIRKEIQGLVSG